MKVSTSQMKPIINLSQTSFLLIVSVRFLFLLASCIISNNVSPFFIIKLFLSWLSMTCNMTNLQDITLFKKILCDLSMAFTGADHSFPLETHILPVFCDTIALYFSYYLTGHFFSVATATFRSLS